MSSFEPCDDGVWGLLVPLHQVKFENEHWENGVNRVHHVN